jgi:hypothetical protein
MAYWTMAFPESSAAIWADAAEAVLLEKRGTAYGEKVLRVEAGR